MAIKIMDKFEPAGDFEVVNAKHVKFDETSPLVEDGSIDYEVRYLKDLFASSPVISPATSFPSGVIHRFLDGESVNLVFSLKSNKPGTVSCTVERCNSISYDGDGNPIPDGAATYAYVGTYERGSNDNCTIPIGTASGFSAATYRISCVDSYQVPCESPIFLFVVTGSISLTSSFQVGKDVYSTDSELFIPYVVDAGDLSGSVNIQYKVESEGAVEIIDEVATNVEKIGSIGVKFDNKLTDSEGNLVFGTYKVTMEAYIGDTKTDLYSSNSYTVMVPVMAANSSNVIITRSPSNSIGTSDKVSVSILPTTSSPAAQGYQGLKALFKIICTKINYTTGGGSVEYSPPGGLLLFEKESLVTHNEEYNMYLGKVAVPTIPSGVVTGTYTINSYTCNINIGVEPVTEISGHTSGTSETDSITVTPTTAGASVVLGVGDRCLNPDDYFNEMTGNWNLQTSAGDSGLAVTMRNKNGSSGLRSEEVGPISNRSTTSFIRYSSGASGHLQNATTDSGDDTSTKGFSIEAYVRCEPLGTGDEIAVRVKTDTTTLSITPKSVSASSGGVTTSSSIYGDEFTHVVVVCSPSGSKMEGTSELYPYSVIKIYIDGALSSIEQLSDIVPMGNIQCIDFGGIYNDSTGEYVSDCNVDVGVLRVYKKALTSSEVVTNYKSCISNADRDTVTSREDHGVSEIYFIKNNDIGNVLDKSNTVNTTFNRMNSIEIKNGTTSLPGSKNAYVNCTMYCSYTEGDTKKWVKYDDVDVWLQGTSSLKYPVKNYQIKVYKDRASTTNADGETVYTRNKYKIQPPGKSGDNRWATKDYVFTLKCDYMEHSHRNNTPTACYYEDSVLDSVISYVCTTNPTEKPISQKGKLYSPAKQIIDADGSTHKYRDAINGFPCVVYYSDNIGGTNTGAWNSSTNTYVPDPSDTLAGTYMFNVDKEGQQLGFKISIDDAIASGVIQETISGSGDEETRSYKFTRDNSPAPIQYFKEEQKRKYEVTLSDRTAYIEYLPCISYEGATNNNSSAAAFYPVDKIDLSYAFDSYIENYYDRYKVLFTSVLNKRADNNELMLYDIYIMESGEWEPIDLSDDETEEYEKLIEVCNQFTGKTNHNSLLKYMSGSDSSAINSYKFIEYTPNASTDGGYLSTEYIVPELYTYNYFIENGFDSYEYVEQTLEPRFTYTEDYEKDDKYNELTYDTMNRAIQWVYYASEAYFQDANQSVVDEEGNTLTFKPNTFKLEFERYFSYEYCLTYYLQMLMFAQVDNAGKNAMFDTWGDGRLYPRPYDMDTQMGLDNSGHDTIPSSCELHWDLSPSCLEYDPTTPASVSGYETLNGSSNPRYKRYNTYESRLWKTFAKVFSTDIQNCYKYLRTTKIDGSTSIDFSDSVYSVNAISTYIDSMTADVISEELYNEDVKSKYLSYKVGGTHSPTYLYVTSGNRKHRYREFLSDRLVFLDTVFNLTESMTNGSMLLRCNSATTVSNIGIAVTTPQYVTFVVDGGEQALITSYVSPTDKFIHNGKEHPGVLFRIPTTGADKNIFIYGIGGVRKIYFLKDLYPTHIELDYATSLIELDLLNSNRLDTIKFGNNRYLSSVNLSGMSALTSPINLSGCRNLRSLLLKGTPVTSLSLPEGAPITTMDISGTNITSLQMSGLSNLRVTDDEDESSLKYNGCALLESLKISNCPLVESIDFEQFPSISDVELQNCDGLTELNITGASSLGELTIQSCDNISSMDLSGSGGGAFKVLDLSGAKSLTSLKLHNTTTNEAGVCGILRLPDTKLTWSKLTLYGSTFNTISTDANVIDNSQNESMIGEFNFDGVEFDVNALTLSLKTGTTVTPSTYVRKITNLSHKGTAASLFRGCKNLVEISNFTYTPSGSVNSMSECCQNCGSLRVFTWRSGQPELSSITSATHFFYGCTDINYPSIKNVLGKLPNVQNVASFVCLGYSNTITKDELIAAKEAIFPSSEEFEYGSTDYNSRFSTELSKLDAGDPLVTEYNRALSESTLRESYPLYIDKDLFKNNTSITNLDSFFYSTMFQAVEDGLLDNLTSVTDVSGLFKFSSLRYIPHTILSKLSNLSLVSGAFGQCPSLGKSISEDVTATFPTGIPKTGGCILEKGFDGMFYTSTDGEGNTEYAPIKNIAGLFCNSPNVCSGNSQNETNNVAKLLAELPYIRVANGAFYGCKNINYLPIASLLHNNTYLCNIDAMFMGTGITKLPTELSSERMPYLTYARGTFSNCASLTGVIGSDFLANCSALVDIGATIDGKFDYTYPTTAPDGLRGEQYKANKYYSDGYISTPGMFGNTNITGCYDSLLGTLSNLRSCSLLFYNGKVSGGAYVSGGLYSGSSTNDRTAYIPDLDTENREFKIHSDTNSYDYIPTSMFSACELLEDASYMFTNISNIMGVYEFDKLKGDGSIDKTKQLESTLFNKCKNNIKYLDGMFIGCSHFSTIDLKDTFSNMTKLETARYMFAGTSLNYDMSETEEANEIFSGCTKLKKIRGMFMNTSLKGVIPSRLFSACRSTLSDTSYLFCGTNISCIRTGKARINLPSSISTKYAQYKVEQYKSYLRSFKGRDGYTYTKQPFYDRFAKTKYDEFFSGNTLKIDAASYGITFKTKDDAYRDALIELFDDNMDTYSDGSPINVDFYEKMLAISEEQDLKSSGTMDIDKCKDWFISETNHNGDDFKGIVESSVESDYVDSGVLKSKETIYSIYADGVYKYNISFRTGTNTPVNRAFCNAFCWNDDVYAAINTAFSSDPSGGVFSGIMDRTSYERTVVVVDEDYIELGLLSECTSLETTDRMFANCFDLQGSIPADIFYSTLSSKNLTNLTNISGMFEMCYKLTLSYGDTYPSTIDESGVDGYTPVNSTYLSLDGGNYRTVYPSIVNSSSNTREIGTAEKQVYFVPEDWLIRCPKITNISKLFYGVGTPRNIDGTSVRIPSPSDEKYKITVLVVPNSLFQQCEKIANASFAFAEVSTIGLTSLNSSFLKASSTTLTNINSIFLRSKLLSVGEEEDRAFEFSNSTNRILSDAKRCFFFAGRTNFTKVYGDSEDINCPIVHFNISGGKIGYETDWYGSLVTDSNVDRIAYSSGMSGYGTRFYDKTKFSKVLSNGAFARTNVEPYNGNTYPVQVESEAITETATTDAVGSAQVSHFSAPSDYTVISLSPRYVF